MIERGLIAALAVAASLAAGACERSVTCVAGGCDRHVTVLTVSPPGLFVRTGGQARALALLFGVPRDAPQTVSWATGDTAVAAVVQAYDTAGFHTAIVTGRSPGRTTLVVAADADPTVKASVYVDVAAESASTARGLPRQRGP